MPIKRKNEYRSLPDLKTHPRHVRVHPAKKIELLAKGIREFGITVPIIADENNIVLAGWARVLACQKNEIEKVPVVILSGLSVGFESAVYTTLVIGAAVFGAYLLGGATLTISLFAVALAGCGLLTTVGVIVAMDPFGPVSDTPPGIAGRAGAVCCCWCGLGGDNVWSVGGFGGGGRDVIGDGETSGNSLRPVLSGPYTSEWLLRLSASRG